MELDRKYVYVDGRELVYGGHETNIEAPSFDKTQLPIDNDDSVVLRVFDVYEKDGSISYYIDGAAYNAVLMAALKLDGITKDGAVDNNVLKRLSVDYEKLIKVTREDIDRIKHIYEAAYKVHVVEKHFELKQPLYGNEPNFDLFDNKDNIISHYDSYNDTHNNFVKPVEDTNNYVSGEFDDLENYKYKK